ncbi:polysaccharide biosynthesis tyrosine autokinase [Ginsengibacter hankyongi]|uniref:non-specific protein-tyrosine kinase n=1 Tax=Ginsengibacter hankyongi TaxID=2607284 RepID=A0A5J5IH53_9BACT|nr:polysaccharide biosynthesis tyrosine autokinase [Ginsengibacter hankyongi]KAA9039286.1 polysaccharide biosynthesis tyrosine autokinase [Ginsengibacter hankyongi]
MQQTNNIVRSQEADESLFQQLISKYLPYWPIFLIALIVGAGVAFAYISYATPIYEADATLIIKDEKKGNEDSKMMESLDQISSKKIVENEIEVIQSRKLMSDVINKLGLYAPIIEKAEIKTSSAYLTSPVSIRVQMPESITGTNEIKLNFDRNNNSVIINDSFKYPLNQIVVTPFGQMAFLENKNYQKSNKPTKQLYFSLINPKYLVPSFLSNLKAEASSKLSSIVNLSYRDEVPKRAEDILNQLIDSYKQLEINEKDILAKNTLAFVEDRLNIVSHDLDSIEKKVQQYKSARGAVDISTQGQLYLQNVSANDQKLSDVNTQLSVLQQVDKFVTSKENTSGIVPSTLGVSDPMLSQLMDKLYTSELEYEKLRKTVGENNPTLVAIRDQINKIKPNILQNIRSQEQSLMATKQNISATNGNYSSMLQGVPQKERQLLDISREQQIKSNIYSFLLQKREESELAYASTVSNNRVVDYAQASPSPVSPKVLLIYLFSILSFMGLCFAFVAIRESLSGKVLYRNEIESRTSIPIIGEVAFDKSKTPVVIETGKRSFVAEEFRKLRISLSFLGINSNHKKILVTSSISGEGKSFIAANLAVSLSLTGKKVVLVDLDLNNPTIAKILNVNQEDGITEYLTGHKDPEEIIKRVKAHENLFFISSGSLPENPTELLVNGKIKEIMDYLDNIFDVIIVDTSPIVLVTDAYILSELCDATLYVVRHKYTPKILIKRIDESAKINPINNPAIIFNGVKMRGFFKNNYGYGYDYVYGNRDKKNQKSIIKS